MHTLHSFCYIHVWYVWRVPSRCFWCWILPEIRKWTHFGTVNPNLSEVQRYFYILTDVVVSVDSGTSSPGNRFMYVQRSSVCHPFRPHSSGNICIVPVQSGRPLRPSPFTGALQERSDARGGGRRRGPRVNPFIYLFMCHGGARADEGVRGAAYSRRMHRTGNPTGTTVRDEGDSKSHGELARGYSTPSRDLSRSSLGIYRVFTYSHV